MNGNYKSFFHYPVNLWSLQSLNNVVAMESVVAMEIFGSVVAMEPG